MRASVVALGALLALISPGFGCGDDGDASDTEAARPVGSPRGARGASEGEGRRDPAAQGGADPAAGALGLDPRRPLVDPALVGREEVCAVAFAERVVEVGPRERTRYPLPVTRRIAVQCASSAGRGWADLVATRETSPRIEEVRAGLRVRVRVAAPDGGFAGYPVLELRGLEGVFEPPPPPPEPEPPEAGFDFGRSAEAGVVGSSRPCGVDFLGRLERLGDREHRIHPYPEEATHRLALKCRHGGGDAWVDLIFDAADAPRALSLAPGRTVPIALIAAEGGYAGRPVGRLGEGPP